VNSVLFVIYKFLGFHESYQALKNICHHIYVLTTMLYLEFVHDVINM